MEAVSADFVNHEAPPGTPPGPGGVTYFMHMLGAGRSPTRSGRSTEGAERRHSRHALHPQRPPHGEFFGLPATGRRFAYKQMHMIRIVGGMGVEHWAVRDDAGLMRQLKQYVASRRRWTILVLLNGARVADQRWSDSVAGEWLDVRLGKRRREIGRRAGAG